jgi:hypothetical protein
LQSRPEGATHRDAKALENPYESEGKKLDHKAHAAKGEGAGAYAVTQFEEWMKSQKYSTLMMVEKQTVLKAHQEWQERNKEMGVLV